MPKALLLILKLFCYAYNFDQVLVHKPPADPVLVLKSSIDADFVEK